MYRLELSRAARRDLEKLSVHMRGEEFRRLRAAIESLKNEPRPYGIQKIRGSQRYYRIRVGNYRVVYEIDDDKLLILVVQVSRRNEKTYVSWRKRSN